MCRKKVPQPVLAGPCWHVHPKWSLVGIHDLVMLHHCIVTQAVAVGPLDHCTSRNTSLTHSVQQVVYVREAVAVWPTKSQRIMGRLSLIKQHQVMFLAWLPYSQGSLNRDGTFYSSATAEKSAVQSAKGAPLQKRAALLNMLTRPFTCCQLSRNGMRSTVQEEITTTLLQHCSCNQITACVITGCI